MDPLKGYFHSERVESTAFIGAGIAGIVAGLWWVFSTTSQILFGAAWPLLGIGLVHLLVGGIVSLRTPRQVARLTALAASSPEMFRIEELERMHRVSQNFIRVRWLEIALFILSGIMLMMYFPTKGLGLGFALALLFESTLSLMLDFFAEERADHYKEFVKRVA